jgi:thiol-disulfide isomerase/thioredoxin
VQILKAVGEAFKDHKEPRLAKGAADLLEQAQILEFQILAQTALDAEFSGNTAKADQRYQLLRKNFANHKDPRLAAEAARILEKHDRRAALIGASLKIQGVLANGAAFDWTPYVGKIVLVQFWASWCGPCIAEMPNLEANYQRFRDRGFEIVGVNLDAERGAADQFLAQRPIPWATVFGDDPNASGFDDVNAVRCGVEAIPFLVLIGRDGKVLALHLRGEQLGKKLEELFASPATQPPLPGAPPTRAAPPPTRP